MQLYGGYPSRVLACGDGPGPQAGLEDGVKSSGCLHSVTLPMAPGLRVQVGHGDFTHLGPVWRRRWKEAARKEGEERGNCLPHPGPARCHRRCRV